MLLDVAKYVFTIVVIGGVLVQRLDEGAVLFGAALGLAVMGIGFFVIPGEE